MRLGSAILSLGILSTLGTGCATPSSMDRPDIIRVSTFYNSQRLWLNFDNPPTDVPQGLKFTVFLTGTQSELGVFGDGTLHMDMFRIDYNPDGEPTRTPVRHWSFNTQEAMPYRGKRPTRYGQGYGFRIPWGDVNVHGKEIQVTVSFERLDGTIVHGQPKGLKVPARVFANKR